MTEKKSFITEHLLNKELKLTLNLALKDANKEKYQYFTVEHLTLALLDNPTSAEILRACTTELKSVEEKLLKFVNKTTPKLKSGEYIQPTLGVQRVLRNAVKRAVQRATFTRLQDGREDELIESVRDKKILLDGGADGADVLISIFFEESSPSVTFLNEFSITQERVKNYMESGAVTAARGRSAYEGVEAAVAQPGMSPTGMGPMTPPGRSAAPQTELGRYSVNLNAKAMADAIEPVIGRDREILQVIEVLSRKRKNNPLLVGEPGVGKTAIAEGLAKMIVGGNVPKRLQRSTIYSLDLGSLMAGTKFRGEFEKRLTGILDELNRDPNAILFIDEIHMIIGAGSVSGGSMDISNLIKPMLASGELKCIGATTYDEYRSIFEKDRALVRRFQKIDVAEPTVEQTIDILRGLKRRFEQYHTVKYTDKALIAAAELSNRYITDRFLPDKAIDIIDEAGALYALLPPNQRSDRIDEQEIGAVVAKLARVPVASMSKTEGNMLQTLEKDLKSLIFGQNRAIEVLVAAMKLSRSGLRDENKPIGSFLFAGPTGVGKTEVTKQLARLTGVKLLRFDMSEYMEKHTVSRLIGAPPGYVGYDKGGLLTDQVHQYPHSIVLFDEIEKAHTDIYNVLLQVMDNGTLTDSNGRKVDFRNSIIIMTTNVGATVFGRRVIGFTAEQNRDHDGLEALAREFSPEFRNRLDAVIQFKPLDLDTIQLVADKVIKELQVQLSKKDVTLQVAPAARLWFAQNGYDPQMGARPMSRLIQENIKKPLADELLFGRLAKGGQVKIDLVDNKLQIEYL